MVRDHAINCRVEEGREKALSTCRFMVLVS